MHRAYRVCFTILGCTLSISSMRSQEIVTTAELVGRTPSGIMTPVNQIVTPAGQQIDLPACGRKPSLSVRTASFSSPPAKPINWW